MAKSNPPKRMKCSSGSRNQFDNVVWREEESFSPGIGVENTVDIMDFKVKKWRQQESAARYRAAPGVRLTQYSVTRLQPPALIP